MEKDGLRLIDDDLMGPIEGFLVISQKVRVLLTMRLFNCPIALETIGKSLLRMDDNILLKSGRRPLQSRGYG